MTNSTHTKLTKCSDLRTPDLESTCHHISM